MQLHKRRQEEKAKETTKMLGKRPISQQAGAATSYAKVLPTTPKQRKISQPWKMPETLFREDFVSYSPEKLIIFPTAEIRV